MATATYYGEIELAYSGNLVRVPHNNTAGYPQTYYYEVEDIEMQSVEIFGVKTSKSDFVSVFGEKAWKAMADGPDMDDLEFEE